MSLENVSLETLEHSELISMVKKHTEEEKSFEYLLDNLHGISWEFDLKTGKFIYVSNKIEEVLGCKPSDWTDIASWAKMLHEDDREEITTFCMEQTRDAKNHTMEYRMRKADGSVIWVLDIVSLGLGAEKKPEIMYGFIMDITKRKEAEAKADKEHRFLQTVINGMSEPVMIIKEDYTVPLMNQVVKDSLVGRTFMDQNSPKCYEISHYRDTPCEGVDDPCPLKDVLATARATKVMHNHKHADGSDQFVELAASPLFNENNHCCGIIETARDITEHIKLTHELQEKSKLLDHQAHHDYLTGLPNRALFMDRLEQGIRDTQRSKRAMALFFMDLDHFKAINDTYGHKMGDEVLREVCRRFKKNTRANDILSRLGGDEFTVILKDMKAKKDIKVIAQKFIDIFATPFIINGTTLKLSTSIGIATFTGQDISAEDLLNEADTAMYKAKENGKNSFSFFEEEAFRYSEVRIPSAFV